MAYMLKRKCEIDGCNEQFVGLTGGCTICPVMLCPAHRDRPFHLCRWYNAKAEFKDERERLRGEAEKDTYARLLKLISQSEIIRQAQALRPGHSIELEIPADIEAIQNGEEKLHNQMNLHLPLNFDDGVKWLVRMRLPHTDAPPKDIQLLVTESEVITQNILKEAGLPTPAAWLPPLQSKMDVSYFFVERLQGHVWSTFSTALTKGKVSEELFRLSIEDFAALRVKLSTMKLPSTCTGIGCLRRIDDHTSVGPLLDGVRSMIPDPPYFLGPFRTQRERYLSQIDLSLSNIMIRYTYETYAVPAYLMLLEARELVTNHTEFDQEDTEFYIKHADERADQYLATDDGHITGILDWEWAYVTTKSEAFAAPPCLYHTPGYVWGDNALTTEEKMLIDAYERMSRPDLADCVRAGRIHQRLADILGHRPWPLAPSVWHILALRRAFLGEGAASDEDLPLWLDAAKKKFKDDEGLKALKRIVKTEKKIQAKEINVIEGGKD